MNTFIKTNTAVQKAFAILAFFALMLSSFAMTAATAEANHGGPYGDAEVKFITLCHWDASAKPEPAYKSSGNVAVESGINGHDGHKDDIIPPFHYKKGNDSLTYPGKNWNPTTQDIWDAGTCLGDGVIPVDVCPNLEGTQTSVPEGYELDENDDCVPVVPPVDFCPNIEGDQASVPEGYMVNEEGDCVEIPVDVCPNLDGVQESLPEGYEFDENDDCVPIDTVDFCPNLEGDQASVPEGYVVNEEGDCVEPVDFCPNLEGDQASLPEGYVVDNEGNCIVRETEDLVCDFSTSDSSVEDGEEFTLTWSTINADSVSIDQGIGNVDLNGSIETSVDSDTTFTLTAIRGEGEGQEEVTCVVDINNESGGGGGGGGGSRISLDRGGNDDDDEDEDEPTPQVLGEATSVVPAGAPNTGAGGTSPVSITLPTVTAILGAFAKVRKAK